MLAIIIPDSPIPLDGFPTCAAQDGREVENAGDFCALDGGKPASLDIVRRSMHRQIRLGLRQVLGCETCKAIPPHELRCTKCAWMRGAIMGMAGIGEQIWGRAEFSPYLEIISTYDPDWQRRVKWV